MKRFSKWQLLGTSSSSYQLSYPPSASVGSKIESFAKLSNRWHHGEGTPPSPETIKIALKLNKIARDEFLLTDAAPGLNGEIQIAVYGNEVAKDKYLEVTVEADGKLNVTRYDFIKGHWQITLDNDASSIQDIKATIEEIAGEVFQCEDTSGYSPKDTTMNIWEGLGVWHSATITAEYQLYKNLAS